MGKCLLHNSYEREEGECSYRWFTCFADRGVQQRSLISNLLYLNQKLSAIDNSGFSSERINLSPFTKDFRGEEHSKSVSLFISARAKLGCTILEDGHAAVDE